MLIIQARDWKLVRVKGGMFEFKGVKAGSKSRCVMLTDTAKYVASNTICFWLSQAVNGTKTYPVAKLTYATVRNIELGKVDLGELNDLKGRLERRGISVVGQKLPDTDTSSPLQPSIVARSCKDCQ